MRHWCARKRGQLGVTLIEVLAVVAVLAAIAGVAVIAVGGVGSDAGDKACATELDIIRKALYSDFFDTRHGGLFPDTLNQLAANGHLDSVPSADHWGYLAYSANTRFRLFGLNECAGLLLTSNTGSSGPSPTTTTPASTTTGPTSSTTSAAPTTTSASPSTTATGSTTSTSTPAVTTTLPGTTTTSPVVTTTTTTTTPTTTTTAPPPVELTDAVGVAGGVGHACAILSDSTVKCWGDNSGAQLGNGTSSGFATKATNVAGLSNVSKLFAGSLDTCARLGDATVKCWGSDYWAQFGDGLSGPQPGNSSNLRITATAMPHLDGIVDLAFGSFSNCGVFGDASVKCWGWNQYGELGNGTTGGLAQPPPLGTGVIVKTPQPVVGLGGNAVAVSAGSSFACAILDDTSVKCWGKNTVGQLGNGTTTDSNVPVAVSGLTGAIAIRSKFETTCVLLTSATVKCWGSNAYGQFGLGNTTSSSSPVAIPGTAVTGFSVNSTVICTLSSGAARCAGSNTEGNLGRSGGASTVPVNAGSISNVPLSGAVQITNMPFTNCVLLDTSKVTCWGVASVGQTGSGSTTSAQSYTKPVLLV